MDPESVAFQPRDDLWRVQNEMLRVQQSQAELSDRVSRLEQKQENDSRLKNVWGTSSPFPSVLGGTPQQVPLQQPHAEHFSNFDDQSNLIGNLQLDDVEEPRRMGATSRANSVRFDETANHGHWAHASRSSLDLIPRAGSGLGGHAMSERSYSHKSDGRQSSAGHSVHSVNSGRANSLTGLGPTLPIEPPGLAPGLFILGSVPAIIRCWLDTNFKHNNLLYAAICTGSLTSYLDMNLVEQLGFHEDIVEGDDGVRKVKLSLYLPEAVPISASSRSNSPAPQLPSVAVDFTIVHEYDATKNPKAIQIFLGSDILRAHNADILFSTNQMTLYDEDRIKLQIPLVRPEDERSFRPLAITTRPLQHTETPVAEAQKEKTDDESLSLTAAEQPGTMYKSNGASSIGRLDERQHVEIGDPEQRPLLRLSSSLRADNKDSQAASPTTTAPRSGASPGIWNNWRRETAEKIPPAQLDWAHVGRTTSSSTAARPRDAGIKVLRPTKSMSRTLSTSAASPSTGQSRFFDEGKKRDEGEYDLSGLQPQAKRSVSGEKTKENTLSAPKSRTTNPVGGASAFAWLNSGSMK